MNTKKAPPRVRGIAPDHSATRRLIGIQLPRQQFTTPWISSDHTCSDRSTQQRPVVLLSCNGFGHRSLMNPQLVVGITGIQSSIQRHSYTCKHLHAPASSSGRACMNSQSSGTLLYLDTHWQGSELDLEPGSWLRCTHAEAKWGRTFRGDSICADVGEGEANTKKYFHGPQLCAGVLATPSSGRYRW